MTGKQISRVLLAQACPTMMNHLTSSFPSLCSHYFILCVHLLCSQLCVRLILALSPGPSLPQRETWYTQFAHVWNVLLYSAKSFIYFLVHMRKIILTKNTELSLTRLQQWFNLQSPVGILLFRCSSIIFPYCKQWKAGWDPQTRPRVHSCNEVLR